MTVGVVCLWGWTGGLVVQENWATIMSQRADETLGYLCKNAHIFNI